MMVYGLGRIENFDERSRDFPLRALISDHKEPRSKTWACRAHLNQGVEGACVGFALAHELAAAPVEIKVTTELARELYFAAQRIDRWPGGAYPGAHPRYEGSSVLAGMKVLKAKGYIPEYRWGFGIDDLIMSVGWLGPSVIGVQWFQGMQFPDARGYISVTGARVGGHAILVRGVDLKRKAFLLHNSWGKDWGVNGTAWISFGDMERLLKKDGEVAIPLARQSLLNRAKAWVRTALGVDED